MCLRELINRLRCNDLMNVEKFRKWCEEMGGQFMITKYGSVKCVFPTSGGVRDRK